MKKSILILLLSLLACGREYTTITEEQYKEYVDMIQLSAPDTLKSPEQLYIKEKLTEIIFTKSAVKNNKVFLTVNREYFIEQGLPDFCYDMVIYDIANTNKVIKDLGKTEIGFIDIAESYREAKDEYLKNR